MIYEFECKSCLGKNNYPCTLSFKACGSNPENDLKCPFKKGPYHGDPKWELKKIRSSTCESFFGADRKSYWIKKWNRWWRKEPICTSK